MASIEFRPKWTYLLPLLHLCACFIIVLGNFESGWEYLTFYVDYPISIFIMSALYTFDHPLVLFGTVGTIWWYVLSWLVARVGSTVRRTRDSRRNKEQARAGGPV